MLATTTRNCNGKNLRFALTTNSYFVDLVAFSSKINKSEDFHGHHTLIKTNICVTSKV